LEVKIDCTRPDAQILGQRTLTDTGRLMQTTQGFELAFLLENSQILRRGYKAQGGFGRLPLCRFTISMRGEPVLAGGSEE